MLCRKTEERQNKHKKLISVSQVRGDVDPTKGMNGED